ncbi:MAG: ribosome silencing factor [Clostridia bacterium]|nr:ribosome silencing factor [Clostridia bacterium]
MFFENPEDKNISFENATPRELADGIVKVLDDKKARNIKLLHVEEQTIIADYFVICEGTSNTQIKALAGEVEYKLGLWGKPPLRMEGYNEGVWVILDFGSVIVHVFNREMRDFYKLEKLWDNGTEIELDLEEN